MNLYKIILLIFILFISFKSVAADNYISITEFSGDKSAMFTWNELTKNCSTNPYGICQAQWYEICISPNPFNVNNSCSSKGGKTVRVKPGKFSYLFNGLINGKTYNARLRALVTTYPDKIHPAHIITSSRIVTVTPNQNTTPSKIISLNDTGISTCSDEITNNLSCPVSNYPMQDAESGLDISKNDNNDGHAGFSFTKIDLNGKELPSSSLDWYCVKDNVTKLIWEIRTVDQGLHDENWTYSWYQPDPHLNGGWYGTEDPQKYGWASCSNLNNCNTDAYIKKVNSQGWCGYKDWRLPTVDELLGIVNYDGSNPSIDIDYFPDTKPLIYLTSSLVISNNTLIDTSISFDEYGYEYNYDPVYISSPLYIWSVRFDKGLIGAINKRQGFSVRLVRSEK